MKKVVLLISLWGSVLLAVEKKDQGLRSQAREIIEIAQNLVLQKDRVQAVRLLYKAQGIEKNKVLIAEIRSILKDIGSLFLYDKAQQEYESSINFKRTDLSKSLVAIERAQKIEPDNTLVMIETIRNYINKKNLEKARESLEEFRAKNPFDKNVIIATAMLALASGEMKDILIAKIKLKEIQLPNQAAINAYTELLEKIVAGNKEKTLQALTIFKKEDAQNPQLVYLENRILGKDKTDDETLCSSFPEHYYRRYYYDLFFCSPAFEHYFKFKDIN